MDKDPRDMTYAEIANKLYATAKDCQDYTPSPDLFFIAGIAAGKLMQAARLLDPIAENLAGDAPESDSEAVPGVSA